MKSRVRIFYGLIGLLGVIFVGRLFYIQVIHGQEFAQRALSGHLKKYEIPAERGKIYLRDGDDEKVPLVLNESRPTLYADPRYVQDIEATAQAVASVIGGKVEDYRQNLQQKDVFYVVLGKKLTSAQVEAINKLELPGVGTQDATYRTYPEGSMAAQTLGFVNDEGVGQYGIEGALDSNLAGQPGLLKAVTDVRGIPLTASDDTVSQPAQNGQDIVLTLDRSVQRYAESALKRGVEAAMAKSGSVIVMDPNSGAVLAMANYPTFNPAKFSEVKNAATFVNGVVSTPYEVGSVVKPFTMSTGLNEGAVKVNDTYYDAGYVQVDDRRIENAAVLGGPTRTMTEIIQRSVNTGVVHVLKQLGGGEVNQAGREKLYNYFTDRFGFGELTGIEQSAEASGVIYSPNNPEGNNVRYANMTFGQGMTLTMLQVVSAYASIVNGGSYYQPYLIHSKFDSVTGETTTMAPVKLRTDVVSSQTSNDIRKMMVQVVKDGGGLVAKRDGYVIGGKTGTSQKLAADGSYSDYLETGTFLGFGAGDSPSYVIMVKVDEPGIGGYAGSVAAAPIFADISNWLIDYYRIPPVR